ncbi:hypothetical protein [Actinotalea sp. Marseille-Q4924]|uniref:hypothetical protein n=1 Tax=Actinotalea sp. Marseille-Q4924 TaxID=2866571 RepID=UPI001CE40477|nr:hypothetical protein [Actinotalea sp. Marseille-Q4924]
MLVTAALVPETVLLLPGTAGAATVLDPERAAAREAVRRLLAAGPERVLLVTSPPRSVQDVVLRHPLRSTTTAAGIPDERWSPGGTAAPGTAGPTTATVVGDPGASVGLALLAEAGWDGVTDALLVAGAPRDPEALRALGAAATADGATAVLLLGALSARRGPDAPLPDDPRAPETDEQLERDLVALDVDAVARLTGQDGTLAADLAISAWAPWQVLVGAAGAAAGGPDGSPLLHGTLLHSAVPLGTTYLVVHWAPV